MKMFLFALCASGAVAAYAGVTARQICAAPGQIAACTGDGAGVVASRSTLETYGRTS